MKKSQLDDSRGRSGFGSVSEPPGQSPEEALQPGKFLGQYQLIGTLGVGGMGSVFEAVHSGLGKSVAIKTLHPSMVHDPDSEARFRREAEAASRLQHPHVVDVTDFGSDGGIIYLVMELLRGEDLGSLLARAPSGLDREFVADIMLAVCAGVFAAHELGVVHRDLKPQNVFLSRTPMGAVLPKVLDFGISKLLDPGRSALTNPGVLMGTTQYLSPEQVMGAKVDPRADQYALGVILYECLTGRRPHEGDTYFAILRSICEAKCPRPRQLRPDLPAGLEAVVLRAMSARPDRRFASVHALGRALLPFASTRGRVVWTDYFTGVSSAETYGALPATSARTSKIRLRAFRPGGRRRFLGAVGLSLAAALGVVFGWSRVSEEPAAPPVAAVQVAQNMPEPVPPLLPAPPLIEEPEPPALREARPAPPPEVRKARKPRPTASPSAARPKRWSPGMAPILD
jgi:serine/threonine protein kinase